MSLTEYIEFSDEVLTAVNEGKALVALESTIISHGMPYPQNLQTAKEVEKTVKDHGAVPATIAVINGKIKAGLTDEDLEILAAGKKKGIEILKASRRDIPFIVSRKLNAATTVSATMIFAEMAGIRIFATGGIGGVHRNARNTFDISADLTELAATDVAVVSAGVKSILDIGLTLEYLETLGVPVIGYGTEEFPAFYSVKSGFKVNYRLNSPEDVADVINVKRAIGLKGGVLIANPVLEKFSMEVSVIDEAINTALKKSESENVKGKEITPYLLAEINEITGGKSLDTNIKLVLNNAKLAAEIAVNLK